MDIKSADLPAYVAHYLAELGGPNDGSAYHSLLEAGTPALPLFIEAFARTSDLGKRITILQLIWQTRSPLAVPILATQLADQESAMWKQALDGLVTIGGPEAISALRAALAKAQGGVIRADPEWLKEALSQLGVHE